MDRSDHFCCVVVRRKIGAALGLDARPGPLEGAVAPMSGPPVGLTDPGAGQCVGNRHGRCTVVAAQVYVLRGEVRGDLATGQHVAEGAGAREVHAEPVVHQAGELVPLCVHRIAVAGLFGGQAAPFAALVAGDGFGPYLARAWCNSNLCR